MTMSQFKQQTYIVLLTALLAAAGFVLGGFINDNGKLKADFQEHRIEDAETWTESKATDQFIIQQIAQLDKKVDIVIQTLKEHANKS